MSVERRVEEVAAATGDDEATILRRGVESYLQQERREVALRIEEFKERYGVDDPDSLEERIRAGEIDEHPAWEEVIEWENLEERARTLDRLSNDTAV